MHKILACRLRPAGQIEAHDKSLKQLKTVVTAAAYHSVRRKATAEELSTMYCQIDLPSSVNTSRLIVLLHFRVPLT